MTKTVIWGTIVLAVTITIAGIFAFNPIQEASSAPAGIPFLVRDNIVVTGLTTPASTTGPIVVGAIVLLDNAGIGGTSDVEVTWTKPFTDTADCKLITVGGTPSTSPGTAFGFPILGNDAAFSTGAGVTSVAHNDVTGTNAILLVDAGIDSGGGCSLGTDYVSITTVASGP